MTPDAILETCLYAEDLDAAEGFYHGTLGLTVVTGQTGRHVFLRCGPGMLLIFNPRATSMPNPASPVPPHGAIGPGHVCFRVDGSTLAAWQSHLAAAGVGTLGIVEDRAVHRAWYVVFREFGLGADVDQLGGTNHRCSPLVSTGSLKE